MERNIWVFIGGFALMIIFVLLIKYSLNFLLISLIIGIGLYTYYEMTLSPEEREKRRVERERRKAEKRHLEFVEKEARVIAKGEAYGKEMGVHRAKEDIRREKEPISTIFEPSPLTDMLLGGPQYQRRRRKR